MSANGFGKGLDAAVRRAEQAKVTFTSITNLMIDLNESQWLTWRDSARLVTERSTGYTVEIDDSLCEK